MSTTQDRINAALGLSNEAAPNASKPGGGASAPSPSTSTATPPPAPTFTSWASDAIGRVRDDVVKGAQDIRQSVTRGAEGAVNETAKKVGEFSDWLGKYLPSSAPSDGTTLTPETRAKLVQDQADKAKDVATFATWHQEEAKKAAGQQQLIPDALIPTQSDSNTGQFIEQATQFGIGLIGAGKLFQGVGIATDAVGVAGKVISAAKGALSQATVFDAYQTKLANLVESNPSLSNPVTRFLASNKDDSLAVAMLKQGIEGTVTGLAQDSLVEGLKILKASRLFTSAVDPAAKLAAKEALTNQIKASDKILTDSKKNAKFTVAPKDDGTFTIVTNLSPEQKAAVTESTKVGGTAGGKPPIAQAITEAAPNAPQLYRGTFLDKSAPELTQLKPGAQITLTPASFSEDINMAGTRTYTGPSPDSEAFKAMDKQRVIYDLAPGAQAVKVGDLVSDPIMTREQEWQTAGKFNVTGTEMSADGVLHVKIEHVPDAATSAEVNQYPRTFATSAQAESEAAWLNTKAIEAKRSQIPGELTTEQKALTIQLAQAKDPDQIKALLQSSTFNYLKVNGQEDAKKWISALTTTMKPELDAARGGAEVTHDMLFKQIQDAFPDGDPTAIMSALSETFKNANDMSAHLNAGRALMYTFGQQVSKLSVLADGDPENALHMLNLGDALDSLFTVAATVKKGVTNVARTMESLKIDPADIMSNVEKNLAPNAGAAASALDAEIQQSGPQSVAARKILASLQGMTLEDMRVLARRLRVADGDPTSILAMMKSAPRELAKPLTSGQKAIAVHNEYWMNALLSGPKTMVTNILSNTTAAFIRPIEYFNAGVIEGNQKMKEKGWDLLAGNFHNLKDSWNMAVKALKTGEQGLDSGSIAKSEGFQNQIGGYVGQVVRVPSRILMASDEFFKQMAYRSNIRAQALSEVRQMGMTDPDSIGKYVSDAMDSAFREDGKGVNKASMEYAQDLTFTKPLDPKGVASKLQGITNAHPLAKVILPFVQTPTNILNWTWERTPLLRQLNSDIRADLAAGGSRRAMAQSKLGTGLAVWSTAAALAATGTITGKGPDNPALRKQWREAGNEPYSIKIGGKQFQYNRLDPLLTPLGIVADMVHMSGEIKDTDMEDIAMGLAASISANITSKTYIAGITNAMDTLTSGSETKTKTFFDNFVGTYVPNALNQTNPDGYSREVRGVVDSMMSRIPGFSSALPTRRNIVGEEILKPPGELNRAINPFTMMSGVKPDILSELLSIGQALPMPKRDIQGVDITSDKFGTAKGNLTPYDRMLQLVGTSKLNGMTLRDKLTDVIGSDEWKALPDDATIKADFASKIIQKYRMNAEIQIKKEFPQLKTAVDQALQSKMAAKTQGQAGVDRINAYFSLTKDKQP